MYNDQYALYNVYMMIVQQVSKPNESGIRQVQVVDAEWDYNDAKLNWLRAMSFLPNWGTIWIRPDGRGGVQISYGRL